MEEFIGLFSAFMYVIAMLLVLAICVIVLIQELRKKEVKRIEASKADSSADVEEDESRHDVEKR